MKLTFLIFAVLYGFFSGPEKPFVRKFFEDPAENRASLDKAINILIKNNRTEECFTLIDSAIKVAPDMPLIQRAINLAIRFKDTTKLKRYTDTFLDLSPTLEEAR